MQTILMLDISSIIVRSHVILEEHVRFGHIKMFLNNSAHKYTLLTLNVGYVQVGIGKVSPNVTLKWIQLYLGDDKGID